MVMRMAVQSERAQRVVRLAAEEAAKPTTSFLFATDGLGAFAARAEAILADTADAAKSVGMSEAEHEAYVARFLCYEV